MTCSAKFADTAVTCSAKFADIAVTCSAKFADSLLFQRHKLDQTLTVLCIL